MNQTEKRAELKRLERRAAKLEQEGKIHEVFDMGVEMGYLQSTIVEEGDTVEHAGEKWTVGKIKGTHALIHRGLGRTRAIPVDDLKFSRC